jgi:hypothetical protein
LYIEWRSDIPDELEEYKEFFYELNKWEKEFLNYFEKSPTPRVTNAIAEGINSVIRRTCNDYKRKWNSEEFKRLAFDEVKKNKPPASCAHCGDVCYPDLVNSTDYSNYLNYKQIIPVGRPRKNFNYNTTAVVEVFCRQCQSEGDSIIEDEDCEGPLEENTAKQRPEEQGKPYTSRDLDDFLKELRNDSRYVAWVQGGRKLRPIPQETKKKKKSDKRQLALQFD